MTKQEIKKRINYTLEFLNSPSSTKILSKLNGLYPISINKITVKGEK